LAESEIPGDFSMAETYLAQAVEGLRKAGQQQYLAPGLIARAELFRLRQKYEDAWADLQEGLEIARLGGMKLFLADYHLEAARLCDAEGKNEEAQTHREEAEKLIKEMNYGRRKF
ncbi:MAG: hypothetical protein L0Y73_08805, partial [Candidatus Aminicenantes bacterium]|nr:hypothetical protein [Candidatus Aminicenantes bacterium]